MRKRFITSHGFVYNDILQLYNSKVRKLTVWRNNSVGSIFCSMKIASLAELTSAAPIYPSQMAYGLYVSFRLNVNYFPFIDVLFMT